ncbi:MAG: glycosyltransferase, partial [Gammaproteobacteria bacterium]
MTDKMIRVLQVMDKCAIRGSPIHGVSRLLLTWWPAFEAAGFCFSLCVLRGGGGTCKAFSEIGVDVHDLSRHKVDPRTVLDIIRLVRQLDIDVLHCHGYGATTFGRLAGKLCGVPVIVQ